MNPLAWSCPTCEAPLVASSDDARRCPTCGLAFVRSHGVWSEGEFTPAGFPDARRRRLARMEPVHFWFGPRMRLLESLLGRTRLPPDAAVVELGCASGRFAGRLARRGLRVCGIEGHAEALAQAQDTPGLELIHGDVCRPPLAPAQFDLVVALDVLEHVPAEPFLAETARLGRRDARLLLSVPAGPRLWSRMDELAGHRCRYTLRQLRAELGASGWRVRHATHYQFLLFPLLMMSRGLARRRELPVEQRPPSPLNALLWAVNLAEVTLLSRFRLPFGSSIVTVAERAS